MIPIHGIRVPPCCIRFPVPCDNQIVGRARAMGKIRHCESPVLNLGDEHRRTDIVQP